MERRGPYLGVLGDFFSGLSLVFLPIPPVAAAMGVLGESFSVLGTLYDCSKRFDIFGKCGWDMLGALAGGLGLIAKAVPALLKLPELPKSGSALDAAAEEILAVVGTSKLAKFAETAKWLAWNMNKYSDKLGAVFTALDEALVAIGDWQDRHASVLPVSGAVAAKAC